MERSTGSHVLRSAARTRRGYRLNRIVLLNHLPRSSGPPGAIDERKRAADRRTEFGVEVDEDAGFALVHIGRRTTGAGGGDHEAASASINARPNFSLSAPST